MDKKKKILIGVIAGVLIIGLTIITMKPKKSESKQPDSSNVEKPSSTAKPTESPVADNSNSEDHKYDDTDISNMEPGDLIKMVDGMSTSQKANFYKSHSIDDGYVYGTEGDSVDVNKILENNNLTITKTELYPSIDELLASIREIEVKNCLNTTKGGYFWGFGDYWINGKTLDFKSTEGLEYFYFDHENDLDNDYDIAGYTHSVGFNVCEQIVIKGDGKNSQLVAYNIRPLYEGGEADNRLVVNTGEIDIDTLGQIFLEGMQNH